MQHLLSLQVLWQMQAHVAEAQPLDHLHSSHVLVGRVSTTVVNVDSHVRRSAGFMFASRQGISAIRAVQYYGKELPAIRARRSLRTAVAVQNSRAANSSHSKLHLILYSKPGCHLCDGLKEKVQAVLDKAAFVPSRLSGGVLEVRNILDRPEWEQAYGLVIPVLTAVSQPGSAEVKIPRPAPRMTAERLGKHIETALDMEGT